MVHGQWTDISGAADTNLCLFLNKKFEAYRKSSMAVKLNLCRTWSEIKKNMLSYDNNYL